MPIRHAARSTRRRSHASACRHGMAWRPRSVPWSKRICATGSTCAKLAYLHFLRRIAASKALRANDWKERPGD